jgi:hypothetical protein
MTRICTLPRVKAAMIAATVLMSAGLPTVAFGAENYETVLGPTPITDSTKLKVTGRGAAIAHLDGARLNVSATFAGLATPATDAHVMMGSGIGIPGAPLLDLTVSPAVNGTVAGIFTLTGPQLAALRDGRLYIQVNSQNAPAPAGNLWGWLLPEHEKAAQDEPQIGHWFLPQGEGLKAHPSGRNS